MSSENNAAEATTPAAEPAAAAPTKTEADSTAPAEASTTSASSSSSSSSSSSATDAAPAAASSEASTSSSTTTTTTTTSSSSETASSSAKPASASSSAAPSADFSVPHPLEHEWTLWYDQRMEPNKRVRGEKVQYENNLRAIGDISTVEAFWSYFNHVVPPSRMELNANYHFFKKGVKPMWEDPANSKGGKWIIVLKSRHRDHLDRMWSNLLLGLIGETLDFDDHVCGAVCSRRKSGDKIALWTRDKHMEDAIMRLGRAARALLEVPSDLELKYQVHEDSMKSARSYDNENKHVC